MNKKLILASSSPYRKQLLQRLRLDFDCATPAVDETPHAGESATDYVARLAMAKAEAVAARYPEAVVIGSDQCALLDGEILGKPGNHARALQQLGKAAGKTVLFQTGLCVFDTAANFHEVTVVPFEVVFRRLEQQQLEHYLRVEQPYDCAGSFKAEGYGISLFSALRGDDPTALTGLPLIALTAMLERVGIEVV